jgi:hypothetical protein
MKLHESVESDIEQLSSWIIADPYHQDCLNPRWWLTGQGILSYRIEDSKGVTMYARLDSDGEFIRLHCQFAPESEVSKLRVIKSILWAIPRMEQFARSKKAKALIFNSVSPSLIEFMKTKFGFTSIGDNDYLMPLEVKEG